MSATQPGQDFGANDWLVEEMYERYQSDPSSVTAEWIEFFKTYTPTTPGSVTAATPATTTAPAAGGPKGGTPPVPKSAHAKSSAPVASQPVATQPAAPVSAPAQPAAPAVVVQPVAQPVTQQVVTPAVSASALYPTPAQVVVRPAPVLATPGEATVEPEDVLPSLSAVVKRECAAAGLALPIISIEPGRNIVGPTTFTLYEVGTIKDVLLEDGSTRRYISVDGGMSDNIRPSLYGAEYSAVLADRVSTSAHVLSRVVGKHCETGDIVIRDIQLPSDIAPGDLLATPATGAYGRSMASNYNHVPRPPVVAIKNGKARVIVRRENEADLLALDVKE